MAQYNYPTIVIGAGAGGLVIAVGLAKAGRKVLLIEDGRYGGDCTNYGCIPSKTLIASAEVAHAAKNAAAVGLELPCSEPNPKGALHRVHKVVAGIRAHEEPAVLQDMGINTVDGRASFVTPHQLRVQSHDGSEQLVTGDAIVIATGSKPSAPPIPGLDLVPYLTNETVFALESVPETLAILGGGPIGCELAQAFGRLGAKVTMIEYSSRLLAREEADVADVMHKLLQDEGISLRLGCSTNKIEEVDGEILLHLQGDPAPTRAKKLLVATGRRPNTDALKLEAVGIFTDERGAIQVDAYGRTAQKNVWAIGDVTGGMQFTHMAESEGRSVLTSLLIPGPFKKKLHKGLDVPRVTFTDPEVASIGLSEVAAEERFGASRIACYKLPFTGLDRALTTGRTEGFIKVVTKKWSSKILGATIVGPSAGELLGEISTAMRFKIPLRKLAAVIHAYPTYSLCIRKVADRWLSQTILPALKRLIGR